MKSQGRAAFWLGLAWIMAGTLCVSGSRAMQSDADIPDADERRPEFPAWIVTRLESLNPDNAESYFLLGEEVIDAATSKTEETLARRLFGLAFELDRRDGSPTWVAPSSCIALASIARLESDARWLRALANRIDPRYAPPAWRESVSGGAVSSVAFTTAEAVGETRAGNGIQARNLLGKPGVRELLLRYGKLLGFSAATGAVWQIDQWAGGWPCRECGNERVVFRPDTDPPSYRECYTCRGNPGPVLSPAQLIAQLRFESRLLHGISRSWGAQLAIDMGAPLREPVADELAAVLGIDADKPYWRSGWNATPDARVTSSPTLDSTNTSDQNDSQELPDD
ncbi:MAG: hypothetical protein Q9O74_09940 [Planctomycetota bacterium]|nr:hypothetical protein [Planctomycetota bacterium]